jgi:hypothetical protein
MSSSAEFTAPMKMAIQNSDHGLKINHPRIEQNAIK